MSDVVVSLEGALISQNDNEEISSEQNEEEKVTNVDESDNDKLFDTVKSDGDFKQKPIPSPNTPLQDSENMLQNKKRSLGKLSKAFQWSLGIFTQRKKKNYDSSSLIPYRCFTMAEILAATNNFNKNLKVGEGGFGSTYKGWIDHGTLEVAIKCTNPFDADESLTSRVHIEARNDLQTHTQLRHVNIISLLGYCAHRGKLIRVYSYMVNKSLDHHLYGEGSGRSPLSWGKRLEICIGAAKGLQYLHYGTTKRIIHRDFKPSHILLDENWDAKISGFELSKVAVSDHVTTNVCGTYGYIDRDYYFSGQLTEKADVYAFGMVLLNVLSARRAYEMSLDEEHGLLVNLFRTCLLQKKIDQIIDPYLIGRISPECLMQYLKVVWDCLLDMRTKRPTMNSVVESLQIAMQLHIDAEIYTSSENCITSIDGRAYNDVLASQYCNSFDHSGMYVQDNDSGNTGSSFTTDFVNGPRNDDPSFNTNFANAPGIDDSSFTTDFANDLGNNNPGFTANFSYGLGNYEQSFTPDFTNNEGINDPSVTTNLANGPGVDDSNFTTDVTNDLRNNDSSFITSPES